MFGTAAGFMFSALIQRVFKKWKTPTEEKLALASLNGQHLLSPNWFILHA